MTDTRTDVLVSPLQLRPVFWASRILFGVVVAHGIFAAVVFDRLPERIPVHFGANGAPDAFASPGLSSWFFIVIVSAALALAIGLVSLAIFRIPPKWINLPKKAAFLMLPEPDRRAVLGVVAAFTMLLGATVCAGLLAIHVAVALAALGAVETFPIAAPFVVTSAVFVVLIVMFIRVSSAVEAATARRVQNRR
jgi:uncharacterized membrane protein